MVAGRRPKPFEDSSRRHDWGNLIRPVKQQPVRWTQPAGSVFALGIAIGIAALIVRPLVGQREAEFFGTALLVPLTVAITLCAVGYLLDWVMRR